MSLRIPVDRSMAWENEDVREGKCCGRLMRERVVGQNGLERSDFVGRTGNNRGMSPIRAVCQIAEKTSIRTRKMWQVLVSPSHHQIQSPIQPSWSFHGFGTPIDTVSNRQTGFKKQQSSQLQTREPNLGTPDVRTIIHSAFFISILTALKVK